MTISRKKIVVLVAEEVDIFFAKPTEAKLQPQIKETLVHMLYHDIGASSNGVMAPFCLISENIRSRANHTRWN